jgi:hypothetical protein
MRADYQPDHLVGEAELLPSHGCRSEDEGVRCCLVTFAQRVF